MYHADLLGGVAARIAGVRNVIWGIRTTDLEQGGKRSTRLIRQICARLSRSIPARIVCAAEASKKAHAAVGYDIEKMIVVPNGFELSRLNVTEDQRRSMREACGLTDLQLVIGSLGRFNAVKDQANFVSATALLAKSNQSLRFLMVGRGLDRDNDELMNQIRRTGYENRYLLMGSVKMLRFAWERWIFSAFIREQKGFQTYSVRRWRLVSHAFQRMLGMRVYSLMRRVF
ncbi:hypothetical protein PspTeo4_01144 [Pseudomonas sp. Teo4]|nr:hypothetical protein [Pseudomonas sp. Teo4]